MEEYVKSIGGNLGYIRINEDSCVLLPDNTAKGNLMINNVTVILKNRANSYDNSSQLVAFPVFSGDAVSSDVGFSNVYFLPTKEVVVDNF